MGFPKEKDLGLYCRICFERIFKLSDINQKHSFGTSHICTTCVPVPVKNPKPYHF